MKRKLNNVENVVCYLCNNFRDDVRNVFSTNVSKNVKTNISRNITSIMSGIYTVKNSTDKKIKENIFYKNYYAFYKSNNTDKLYFLFYKFPKQTKYQFIKELI